MVCRNCGQDKVSGAFTWKTNGGIAHGQKCKLCMQKLRYSTRGYKEGQRDRNYQRLYGISLVEYRSLLEKQGGKCAICNKESDTTGKNSRLHIDHDHKTGKVRALLCYRCNIAMGYLAEDSDRIFKILDYLSIHSLKEVK